MLFPVAEVTRSLSSLIKSGFVSFASNNKLVIDTNKHKIITGIDAANEEAALREQTMEEALADALIRDAGLDDEDFSQEDLLTMDAADLPHFSSPSSEELGHIAQEVIRSAKEEAEEIIDRAHDEAEQMRSEAYDESERIKEDARQSGYQEGYQQGAREASEEMERKNREFEAYMASEMQELEKKEIDLVKRTEHRMVDWLCQMIPQITGVVMDTHRDVLLYMVNAAMHDLDNSTRFVIRVSCDDYEMLQEHRDEIYGALNPNIDMEIFEDAKLSAAQCVIETDNGIVDVSLDVQLDNLITALKLMIKE